MVNPSRICSQRALSLLAAVAVLISVCSTTLAVSSKAQASLEPTPTLRPTSPPAAPDFVTIDGTLVWRDNSDNEDGFRVEIDINGELFVFTVEPNVTSFQIPPQLSTRCGTHRFTVFAFNAAGEAGWIASPFTIIECPGVLPTAVPTPASRVLPRTGTGPAAPFASYEFLSVLVAVGVLSLLAGAASRYRR